MLDNQISEVEGKVSSETEKIKEMVGLIEKAPKEKKEKKAPAKKDDKKAEPKKAEKKEEPKADDKKKSKDLDETQLNEYGWEYVEYSGNCYKVNDEGVKIKVPDYYCR
jgi:hypothetical protein